MHLYVLLSSKISSRRIFYFLLNSSCASSDFSFKHPADLLNRINFLQSKTSSTLKLWYCYHKLVLSYGAFKNWKQCRIFTWLPIYDVFTYWIKMIFEFQLGQLPVKQKIRWFWSPVNCLLHRCNLHCTVRANHLNPDCILL